ncbi:hypothetical protein [Paeniglutamicibacter sp. Y32M11]|uniref:hypothetical protein n=1 Tax=Paeniglutamicibacter sp. Y32M11 TaxID=2853258 RepID=UPI00104BC4C0|nr:hypothetical protein [Paeniglutamicibacter sp. Y32M11]QXQ10371.1 hypothetical protein KUF55_18475 [Paeniglutamicibacter sp. Y32M11]
MSDKSLPIVEDITGLSLSYRFFWRLQYLGFSIFGPADLLPHRDPRQKMKRERARIVLRAHEVAGTPAPDEVISTAAS